MLNKLNASMSHVYMLFWNRWKWDFWQSWILTPITLCCDNFQTNWARNLCLVPNEASFKRLSKTCTAFNLQRIWRGDILKTMNSSFYFTCLVRDFSPFWNKDNRPPKQKAICLKMLRNKTVTNHLSVEKRIITIDPSVYPYDPFLCRHFDFKALYPYLNAGLAGTWAKTLASNWTRRWVS